MKKSSTFFADEAHSEPRPVVKQAAGGRGAARADYFLRVIRRHQWLNGGRCLMDFNSTPFPTRPAWIEIDLGRLRRNLQLIRRDLPAEAKLLGGVSMDALMVDVTSIPQAQMWDEAVLMGRQGDEEITVHDLAKLKHSVSYDVLTSWRLRLSRQCVNVEAKPAHTHNGVDQIGEPALAK